jgi:hypothetical protein
MRAARRDLVAPVAALLLLVAAGCGGDDAGGDDPDGAATGPVSPPAESAPAESPTPGAPAEALDPCGLLTADEVAAVAGAEVTRTEGPVEEFLGRQCEWFFPHPTFGEERVTVSTWVGLEFYSPSAPGQEVTGFEPVPGIGDEAHRWPPGQGICTVIFRLGEHVVQVLSGGVGDDACVDLARTAADRV